MDYGPNSADEVEYERILTTPEFDLLMARYKRSVYELYHDTLPENDLIEKTQVVCTDLP